MSTVGFKKKGKKIAIRSDVQDAEDEFEALMSKPLESSVVYSAAIPVSGASVHVDAGDDAIGPRFDELEVTGMNGWNSVSSDFAASYSEKETRSSKAGTAAKSQASAADLTDTTTSTASTKSGTTSADAIRQLRAKQARPNETAVATTQYSQTLAPKPVSTHISPAARLGEGEVVFEGAAVDFLGEEEEEEEEESGHDEDAMHISESQYRLAHATRIARKHALKQQAKLEALEAATGRRLTDETDDGEAIKTIDDHDYDVDDGEDEVVIIDRSTVGSGGFSKMSTISNGKHIPPTASSSKPSKSHKVQSKHYPASHVDDDEDDAMRDAMLETLRSGLGGGAAADSLIARLDAANRENYDALSDHEQEVEFQDFESTSEEEENDNEGNEAGEGASEFMSASFAHLLQGEYSALVREENRWKEDAKGLVPLLYPYSMHLRGMQGRSKSNQGLNDLLTTFEMLVLRPGASPKLSIGASGVETLERYDTETPARRRRRAMRLAQAIAHRSTNLTFEQLDLADEHARLSKAPRGPSMNSSEPLTEQSPSQIFEQTLDAVSKAAERAQAALESHQMARDATFVSLQASQSKLNELEGKAVKLSEEYITYERSIDFINDLISMLSAKLPHLSALQRASYELKRQRFVSQQAERNKLYRAILSEIRELYDFSDSSGSESEASGVDEFGRDVRQIRAVEKERELKKWSSKIQRAEASFAKFLKGALVSEPTGETSSTSTSTVSKTSLEAFAEALSVMGGCVVPVALLRACVDPAQLPTSDPLLTVKQVFVPAKEGESESDGESERPARGESLGWSSKATKPDQLVEYALSNSVPEADRHHYIALAAKHLCDDADEPYRTFDRLLELLGSWKQSNAKRYGEAYISQMLPLLIAPYLRMEMLASNLIGRQDSKPLLEVESWYKALQVFSETKDDPDAQLLPATIAAVVTPILETSLLFDWTGSVEDELTPGQRSLYKTRVYADPWGELIEMRRRLAPLSGSPLGSRSEGAMDAGPSTAGGAAQSIITSGVIPLTGVASASTNCDTIDLVDDEDEDEDVRRAKQRQRDAERLARLKRLEQERLDREEDLALEEERRRRLIKMGKTPPPPKFIKPLWHDALYQFGPTHPDPDGAVGQTKVSKADALHSLVQQVVRVCVSQPGIPLDSELSFYVNWRERNKGAFQLAAPEETGAIARDAMCSRLLSTTTIRLAVGASEVAELFDRTNLSSSRLLDKPRPRKISTDGPIQDLESVLSPLNFMIHLTWRAVHMLRVVVDWRKTLAVRDDPGSPAEPPFPTKRDESSSSSPKIPDDWRVDALVAHHERSTTRELKKRLVSMFSKSLGRYPLRARSRKDEVKLPACWALPSEHPHKTAQALAYYLLMEVILPYLRMSLRCALHYDDEYEAMTEGYREIFTENLFSIATEVAKLLPTEWTSPKPESLFSHLASHLAGFCGSTDGASLWRSRFGGKTDAATIRAAFDSLYKFLTTDVPSGVFD